MFLLSVAHYTTEQALSIKYGNVQATTSIINSSLQFILVSFTIIAVIIAYCQYTDAKKRARKEKSFELARLYANEVIPKLNFVSSVYIGGNVSILLKKYFPTEALHLFNLEELNRILAKNNTNLQAIKNAIMIIPTKCYLEARIYDLDSMVKYQNLINSDAQAISQLQATKKQATPPPAHPVNEKELMAVSMSLLNDLEAFSMHLVYETADEALLYQSLHQTFISAIQLLYWQIAEMNKNTCDKYFTNIICLYDKWVKILTEEETKKTNIDTMLEKNGIRTGKK